VHNRELDGACVQVKPVMFVRLGVLVNSGSGGGGGGEVKITREDVELWMGTKMVKEGINRWLGRR
jgi:hypothetical protein